MTLKRRPKPPGYGYTTDLAISALITTSRSLVGATLQARELIMALCDQAGASLDAQRAIRALIARPLCPNCNTDAHARCCAWCGGLHDADHLRFEHCSAKCAHDAEHADRISAAMEDSPS